MRPLNIRNYIFYSLKEVFPQILLLMIKTALFIFLCSIGFAVMYGLKKDSQSILNKYVSVNFGESIDEGEKQKILTNLRNMDGYQSDIEGVTKDSGLCKLIIFNTFCWQYVVDSTEDVEYVLSNNNGKLIEGRLPNQPGEIIISDQLSRSLKKDIGDRVGQQELLEKQYTITGIYKGEHNLYIINDSLEEIDGYIFKVNTNDIDSFISELEQYNDVELISNKDQINTFIKNVVYLLKILGIIILIITAIELTISVSNLNRVYFTERSSEFALLRAVGYNHKFILKRVEKELALFILLGLIGGIILGQIIMFLFYHLYCYEKGVPYQIFEPGLLALSAALSVIVFIFSYFPTRKYLKSIDFVEVLQQNS